MSDICSELGIIRVDLKDWENALFQEIKSLLEHVEDKESARPTTGNIYQTHVNQSLPINKSRNGFSLAYIFLA